MNFCRGGCWGTKPLDLALLFILDEDPERKSELSSTQPGSDILNQTAKIP